MNPAISAFACRRGTVAQCPTTCIVCAALLDVGDLVQVPTRPFGQIPVYGKVRPMVLLSPVERRPWRLIPWRQHGA